MYYIGHPSEALSRNICNPRVSREHLPIFVKTNNRTSPCSERGYAEFGTTDFVKINQEQVLSSEKKWFRSQSVNVNENYGFEISTDKV